MNFNADLAKKNSFKFNELTSVVGVKPYVLRFWESEFEQINPILDSDGQKLYSTEDFEYVSQIKELLFVDKFSIVEAKNILAERIKLAELELEAMCTEDISEDIDEADLNISEEINLVLSQHSSLDLMKKALASDFMQVEEKNQSKILTSTPMRELSDKDIVNLVLAKKKLTGVLNKINEFIH